MSTAAEQHLSGLFTAGNVCVFLIGSGNDGELESSHVIQTQVLLSSVSDNRKWCQCRCRRPGLLVCANDIVFMVENKPTTAAVGPRTVHGSGLELGRWTQWVLWADRPLWLAAALTSVHSSENRSWPWVSESEDLRLWRAVSGQGSSLTHCTTAGVLGTGTVFREKRRKKFFEPKWKHIKT